MKKILLFIAITLSLSGCIVVDVPAGSFHSGQPPAVYPEGMTYDWFQVGLHPDAGNHAFNMTQTSWVTIKVCFPATWFPRQYVTAFAQNGASVTLTYGFTTDAGCTVEVPVWLAAGGSLGWMNMAAIGGGETFSVKAHFNDTADEAWQLPLSARVQQADGSFHDF
jgi:hypothetical protein